MAKTDFSAFLEKEVNKVRWLSYPVKAGFLRRVFVRKADCSKLHPNPNDEFCQPAIGPNYEIITRYMADYRWLMSKKADALDRKYAVISGIITLKSPVLSPVPHGKLRPVPIHGLCWKHA